MQLVATLAAGVQGAENGHAEIYARGTTTRASFSFTFEGGVDNPAVDIPLDSHGGVVVYVTELCNVVVKTSGGAVLREFVAGDRDDSVEVVSDAFTGTSYGSGLSAPGQPTTLGDVLDRWLLFNGGTDWQIGLPGGSTGSIKDAIAGTYGLVFSVKAYGAVGNGIAFDTGAINSAIAAASVAGGVVYFPPGTYRTTGNHDVPGQVSLLGAGRATAIVMDNLGAGAVFNATAGTSPECWQRIAEIYFRGAAATPSRVLALRPNCQLACSNLYVDGTNFPGTLVVSDAGAASQLSMQGCTFRMNSASRVVDTPSSNFKRLLLRDCRFITPASYTNNTIIDANLFDIQACVFDNALTTTGTYTCVRSSSSDLSWRISGCRFSSAAGATVTAMGLGAYSATSNVVESDNFFGAGIKAYSYTTFEGQGAQVHLKSRELRSIYITDNTDTLALPIDQYGVVVLHSNSLAIWFNATAKPPVGATGTVVVHRPLGAAAGNARAGDDFLGPEIAATASNTTHIWQYRVCVPNVTVRMVLDVSARFCQAGA